MRERLIPLTILIACTACVPMRIKELVPAQEHPPHLRFFANRACQSAPYGYFYSSPTIQSGMFGLEKKDGHTGRLTATFRSQPPRTLAIANRPLTITYAGRAPRTVPFTLSRVQTRTHVDTKYPSGAGYDKTSTGPWRYHVVKKERSLMGLKSKVIEELDYDYSPVRTPLAVGKPYVFRITPGFETDEVALEADVPLERLDLRIELPIDDDGQPLTLEFEYLDKWTFGAINC